MRTEAKARQSEQETDRESYKPRGKTLGMWELGRVGVKGGELGRGEQNDILRSSEAKVSCDLE